MCTISRFLGNLQKIIIHIKSIGSVFPAVTAKVRGRSKRQKIRPLGHAAAAASPQPGNAPGSPPLPRMDDPHGCSVLETQSSTCHPTAQRHTFLQLKMHGINGGWGLPSHVFNNSSSLAAWLHWVCYPPLWLGRCPKAETTQLDEDFSPFSPLQHPTSSSGGACWQLPMVCAAPVCPACHLAQNSLLARERYVFEMQANVLLARTNFFIWKTWLYPRHHLLHSLDVLDPLVSAPSRDRVFI